MNLNEMAVRCAANSKAHGFHDKVQTFGDYIALMHSELSEALEAFRDGAGYADVLTDVINGKPEGIPCELADVIIRILDFCGRYEVDIQEAVEAKMAYNSTRPHLHGGKLL